MPAALQDRAPRIVETDKGAQQWVFDGKTFPQLGFNALVGRADRDDFTFEPARFDDMRPGLLRHPPPGPGHGHQRRVGIGVLSLSDHRLLRTDLLGGVRPGAGVLGDASVQRLDLRGVVGGRGRPDRSDGDHLSGRCRAGRRGDPPQRRAGIRGRLPARAASVGRNAVHPLGLVGSDHPGLRRHRHGHLPAHRLVRGAAATRPGRAGRARGDAVPGPELRVLRRVALVRHPGALSVGQDRHERGRHRLGADADGPPRLHDVAVGSRPKGLEGDGHARCRPPKCSNATSGTARSRTLQPSACAIASVSITSCWKSTIPTPTAPGRTPRPTRPAPLPTCPSRTSGE